MSSTRQHALGLYRAILRSHRQRLPFHLRQLGDSYVRDEFKRHKKADAKFLVSFFGEWEGYLRTLQTQSVAGGGGGGGAGSGLGRELSGEERAQLTDEQRVQLDKLRKEATGLYKDG